MSKHWKITAEGTLIEDVNGETIAYLYPKQVGNQLVPQWDNVNLIAAAPELLEVCKSILTDYGYDSSIRKQLEEVIAKI